MARVRDRVRVRVRIRVNVWNPLLLSSLEYITIGINFGQVMHVVNHGLVCMWSSMRQLGPWGPIHVWTCREAFRYCPHHPTSCLSNPNPSANPNPNPASGLSNLNPNPKWYPTLDAKVSSLPPAVVGVSGGGSRTQGQAF